MLFPDTGTKIPLGRSNCCFFAGVFFVFLSTEAPPTVFLPPYNGITCPTKLNRPTALKVFFGFDRPSGTAFPIFVRLTRNNETRIFGTNQKNGRQKKTRTKGGHPKWGDASTKTDRGDKAYQDFQKRQNPTETQNLKIFPRSSFFFQVVQVLKLDFSERF